MAHDSYEYMITVYEAHDRLASWDDPDAVADVADRLRAIAPDHKLLPVLEAKWRSMVEHVVTTPPRFPFLPSPLTTAPFGQDRCGTGEQARSCDARWRHPVPDEGGTHQHRTDIGRVRVERL